MFLCLVSVGGAVAGGGGGGGGRDRVGEMAGGWVKRRGDFTQVGSSARVVGVRAKRQRIKLMRSPGGRRWLMGWGGAWCPGCGG